jgi:hypothetical protein
MLKFIPLLFLPALLWGRDSWYAIGPMFHLNFGNGKISTSLALEWSWWSFEETHSSVNGQGPLPPGPEGTGYGFDLGAEVEFHGMKSKLRLYTESQVSAEDGGAGLSLGPVLEIVPEYRLPHLGIQGSAWFLVADLRMRYMDAKPFFCPGLYFKFPAADNP